MTILGTRPSTDEFVFSPPAPVDVPRLRHAALERSRRGRSAVSSAFATIVVVFLAAPSIAVAFGYRTIVDHGDVVITERASSSVVGVMPAIGYAYSLAVSTMGRVVLVGAPLLYVIVSEWRRKERSSSRRGAITTAIAAAVIVVAGPIAATYA